MSPGQDPGCGMGASPHKPETTVYNNT